MSILIPNQEYDIPPHRSSQSEDSYGHKNIHQIFRKIAIYLIFGILVGIVMLVSVKGKSELFKENSTATNKDKIIKKVAKIIDLPNETPTLIEIVDPEKINNFQFFSKADIGDQVLIFSKSGKAILYRPREDKIIEVGRVLDEKETPKTNSENKVLTPTNQVPSFIPTSPQSSDSSSF